MKIPQQSPLKQIRKQCLECCGGSIKRIRFCHSVDCSLWFLRQGMFPRTYINKKVRSTSNYLTSRTSKGERNSVLIKLHPHIGFENENIYQKTPHFMGDNFAGLDKTIYDND